MRSLPRRLPVLGPYPYLNGVLGEIAASASRTGTLLGERYRRLARRCGKREALVALARSISVIIFHLLADPEARFRDLGPDFYDNRISAERKIASHVRQLHTLGLTVTLTQRNTPPNTGHRPYPKALTARTSQGRCRAPTIR